MEYQSPRQKLFDLIEEYQLHFGYTFKESISEVIKILTAAVAKEDAKTGK